ncbi:hypothetical protein [Nocardioides cynanchi]|uniref:hypothetical protein n=1 Tax=Nocardioides cynanchi TaxID=2558918 RepID=UPI00124607F0|nr:hypothetical protein [Nocardioides cynanchi]
MPKGPHELRLDTYVANGNVDNIAYSSHMWERGHTVLNNLADALESAKPHLLSRFGPQTGPAAVAAFETVAKNVRAQAAEMKRASTALTSAGHALEDAQHTHHSLGNAPAAPPADPTQKAGESAGDFHTRQHAAHQAQSGYAAEYADRERRAQTAITTVDTHYTQAIKVMESIHGQPPSHTGGSGGGGGGSIPTATLPGAGHHSAPTATGVSWATGQGSGHHHHVDPRVVVITDPTDPSTDPGHDGTGPGSGGEWPPGEHPGVPQGPGQYPPGTYPPGTYPPGGGPDVPPGGSLPPGATSTGPSSTMVGGLMTGGLVGGASGLSNALRGSAVTSAMTEEESLAATRAGSTGAAGGRGASAGAAGTSRGSGGRGTGAGGRGDRGRKKKRAPGIDFFEDNEDWLDEDEVSPPVLH